MIEYIEEFKKHWLVVAKSNQVKKKPYKVILLGIPIVLARIDNKLSAFMDVCPHRNAPLSAGRIINHRIECPYHGWQFDKEGVCQNIPGLCDFSPHHSRNLKTFAVYESNNLIWVKISDDGPKTPYLTNLAESENYHNYVLTTITNGKLINVLENFLDGTHTHFVHNGLIRSTSKRKSVMAKISTKPNMVEIEYHNEGKQSGFISKLFETERSLSIARFIMPSIAELEYRSPEGITILFSVYFTPVTPGLITDNLIKVFALIAIKKNIVPNKIKEWVINPFLSLAIKQDKAILKLQADNINIIAKESFINTKLDLVRPYLLRLLSGNQLSEDDTAKEIMLEL